MLRKIGLLGIVALLVAAAPVRRDDTYTIKIKKNGKGAVTQQKKEVNNELYIKSEGPEGKALSDEKKSKITIKEYKETILEKEKGKRATKIRREYSKAVLKVDGKEKILPYDGKTLLIEKMGDKYHFTIEGGEELKGEDAESLDHSFNKPIGGDNEELEKAFLPKKPVAVNDTWKIDPEELVKTLSKDTKQELSMDKSKVTGRGKLLRAYKKNGRQYGVFDIDVKLPLMGDFPLDKDAIQEGSMTFYFKVDACIDGTSSDAVSEISMKMEIVSGFKTPGGLEHKLILHTVSKGKETVTDLAKK